MTSASIGWLVGLALFAGGLAVGALLVRFLAPAARSERQIRRELDQTREQLDQYQREVDQHFRETAEAVNDLTDSYRRVHEQLRRGAESLCASGTEDALPDLRKSLLSEPSQDMQDADAVAADSPAADEDMETEGPTDSPGEDEPDRAR